MKNNQYKKKYDWWWDAEPPEAIDEDKIFMDGTDFLFQDGTDYIYN